MIQRPESTQWGAARSGSSNYRYWASSLIHSGTTAATVTTVRRAPSSKPWHDGCPHTDSDTRWFTTNGGDPRKIRGAAYMEVKSRAGAKLWPVIHFMIMRVCFWDVTLRMAMNRTSASYSLRLLLFRGHRLRETGRLETSSFASPYVHRAPSRMCGRVVRGYNDHVFLLYALFRLAFISRRPNSPEICFAL